MTINSKGYHVRAKVSQPLSHSQRSIGAGRVRFRTNTRVSKQIESAMGKAAAAVAKHTGDMKKRLQMSLGLRPNEVA